MLTSLLVNDSRAWSRTRVSSLAKKPSQNQKSSLEPESKLSLNAARARSNLSQSQCCQKPGIARAKCSYKKSIRLSCSQTKDLDTRVFLFLLITSRLSQRKFFHQFSRGAFKSNLIIRVFPTIFDYHIRLPSFQKSKNSNPFSRSIRKPNQSRSLLLRPS